MARGWFFWVALVVADGWAGNHSLAAADWPQLLGPARDGAAAENQQLAETWPRRLKPVWTHALGAGYSGPVVAGEQVIVFHRQGEQDLLESLDFASGRTGWSVSFAALYGGGINADNGPRCTPVVDGRQVFAFSAAGDLFAIDLADGKQLWKRNLYNDYRAQEGFFGAGSTPLVWQDRVIINVGGRAPKSGVVAVDRATGNTLWTATTAGSSYASPVMTQFGGEPCVVAVTRLTVVGLNPQTGAIFFEFPFGNSGPAVNGATPLAFQEQLFVSASYGVGARLVKLAEGAEVIWKSADAMASQYSTCVYHDGCLYGSHGREDGGATALRCLDAQTGKVLWSQESVDVANVIRLGSELLVLQVKNGALLRVALDPTGYRELAKTQVADTMCRSLPALDRGKLLVRTNPDQGGELLCLPVGQPKP